MQILIWLTSNYWTTWRSTTRWTRTYEGLRGARTFHLVSLSLQISLTDLPGPCLGLCVGVACFCVLGCFVVGFFLLGKFDLNHRLIPVVDRPCLALVWQCRKKKLSFAVVRGWWSASILSCWWSILHEFFRRTLSRSFRELPEQ